MIKCEVIKRFRLKDFDKLKNIQRASIEIKGELLPKDTFECDEEMVKYLSGDNAFKEAFVKVIEVLPKKEEPIVEVKPKKKKSSKKGE